MKNYFLILFILLTSALSFGHGENKPGPHGGFIRMPGAFHTEVVQVSTQQVKVYLLDIEWKNPSVKDSSVEISFEADKKFDAKCEKQKLEFLCTFDKGVDLNSKGKISVKASREKQPGGIVEYVTPLKIKTL